MSDKDTGLHVRCDCGGDLIAYILKYGTIGMDCVFGGWQDHTLEGHRKSVDHRYPTPSVTRKAMTDPVEDEADECDRLRYSSPSATREYMECFAEDDVETEDNDIG
jgi:hypothetical protein